jgi:penicillin-binding protein 1A
MALGSSSFSPAEMTRAYNILVNPEKGKNLYFIEKILNRNNEILFSHQALETNQETAKNIDAFPWFKTQLNDQDRPFLLLRPLTDQVASLDPRATYITKDILREALSRGNNGRKTNILNRSDIGGKTGTTNNAISTWFSGFHNDLVSTVWIGTDDFSSLGKNEYGSSIALPTWVDFMKVALTDLPEENWDIPDGLSYVKVDSDTGQPTDKNTRNSYFELFFEEID